MTLVSHPASTRLAHRKVLALRDRVGDSVECIDGSVWVTQDGDPRDLVLDPGESFTLDRPGTALVYALEDARIDVRRANTARQKTSAGLVRRLRELVTFAPSTTRALRATRSPM